LPISGPFSSNDEYLVVADHLKQNIYQLKPDSGEVRALAMSPCHPVSVTFDPSINGLYMTCSEDIRGSTTRTQYRIRKKTFDGRIDQVVYNALWGMLNCSERFCVVYYVEVAILSRYIHEPMLLLTTKLCLWV